MKSHPHFGWLFYFHPYIYSVTLQSRIIGLKKIFYIPVFLLLLSTTASTQTMQFSAATDLGLMRSFKEGQQFWTFGHTIHGFFDISPKEGVYIWFSYYNRGKFSNNLSAIAKSPLTLPQEINYVNRASLFFKHFSVGWRKFLVGRCDNEKGWNLYTTAGLGLLFGRVSNVHSTPIDTADYNVPVLAGAAKFKRLTADLSLGYEKPLGAGFFLYGEGRVWIPASDYPSKYIFVNEKAPLTGMFNIGLRVLF